MTDEKSTRHPSVEALLAYFTTRHLPPHLAVVSEPFGELAQHLVGILEDSPELTAGLRKLLEAKDCAVRAAVTQHKRQEG